MRLLLRASPLSDSALAERGIAIFAVSTYDTDYILVKAVQFEGAARALGA